MVRSDLKGAGLGYGLMTHILDYARARGIGRVFGDVLSENTTMLQMSTELGFKIVSRDLQSGVVTIEINLPDPKS